MTLKNLWKDPEALDPGERKYSVQVGLAILAGLGSVLLVVAMVFSHLTLDPYGELYLIQASVRLGLSGVGLAAFRFVFAMTFAVSTYQILENSETGQRVPNKSLLLASLIIGAALVFGGSK